MRATPCLLALGMALLQSSPTLAREARYVEDSDQDPDTISLGYPVPQPRSQSAPFAGFRDLAGIRTRMAELALEAQGPRLSLLGQSRNGQPIEQLCFGPEGLPLQVLQSGGIHAREWASPEAVLGIAEALTLQRDQPLYAWLADTLPLCLIPVLNPDGFASTQAHFDGTRICEAPEDGNAPANCSAAEAYPRDGRMRRKNLRDSDGVLSSADDALFGVDLNRNLGPFFNLNNGNSASPNPRSIIYRGPSRGSEPEAAVLENIAANAAVDQLRLFIDTHSFSRLYYWNCSDNPRVDNTAQAWVERFRRAARQAYANVPTGNPSTRAGCGAFGIGASDELFAFDLDIPAYTLELEPSNSTSEYGGLGFSHDGFVLPESIVPAMRLDALRMAAQAYTLASGPPWLRAVELSSDGGQSVYSGRWQEADAARSLNVQSSSSLSPGQLVQLELEFDRPMRWLDSGSVGTFPMPGGSSVQALNPALRLRAGTQSWTLDSSAGRWEDGSYPTQRFLLQSTIPADWNGEPLRLEVSIADNAAQSLDANPGTPAQWRGGAFDGVEAGADACHVLSGGAETDCPSTPPPPSQNSSGGGSGTSSWLLLLVGLMAPGRRRWLA